MTRGLLAPSEVAPFAKYVRTALSQRYETPVRPASSKPFTRAVNMWRRDMSIGRLVASPRLASAAAALLGVDGVRLYTDQAIFKAPGDVATPWHTDAPMTPFDDSTPCVTAWIPLAEVTTEMGPPRYATGSHHSARYHAGVYGKAAEASIEKDGRDVAEYGGRDAGDVSWHHCRTLYHANAYPKPAPGGPGGGEAAPTREAIAVTFVDARASALGSAAELREFAARNARGFYLRAADMSWVFPVFEAPPGSPLNASRTLNRAWPLVWPTDGTVPALVGKGFSR